MKKRLIFNSDIEDEFVEFLETLLSCAREVLLSEEDFYIFRFHIHPFYDNYEQMLDFINAEYNHNPPLTINAVQQRFTRAKKRVLDCIKSKTGYNSEQIELFWQIVAELYL